MAQRGMTQISNRQEQRAQNEEYPEPVNIDVILSSATLRRGTVRKSIGALLQRRQL